MASYYTPGVYVEEVSVLPPSVASVSTAIPAFIGYTQKGKEIARISTMLEYREKFGGPQPTEFLAQTIVNPITQQTSVEKIRQRSKPQYIMYHCLDMYFKNGGGACYISSAGNYGEALDKGKMETALKRLENEDEPTLIVFTDANNLGSQNHLDLCQAALVQCKTLGDRFTIMDLPNELRGDGSDSDTPPVEFFRKINADLQYGAAYTPFLNTSLTHAYDENDVDVAPAPIPAGTAKFELCLTNQNLIFRYTGSAPKPQVAISSAATLPDLEQAIEVKKGSDTRKLAIDVGKGADAGELTIHIITDSVYTYGDVLDAWQQTPKVEGLEDWKITSFKGKEVKVEALEKKPLAAISTWAYSFGGNSLGVTYTGTKKPELSIVNSKGAVAFTPTATKLIIHLKGATNLEDYLDQWEDIESQGGHVGWAVTANGDKNALFTPAAGIYVMTESVKLATLAKTDTALYNQIRQMLSSQRVVLPPSSAIAGVYARVDRNRGVWKAPANEAVLSVLGPTQKINDAQQALLNVDPTSGISINVIRSFPGKGTLVWGARTMAGNDNEWRYVSVRRLFIMIEESTRKASAFAVFEANDATTWLKVRTMIEGFLFGLWQQGALAGSTPEAAYFVNVGLGKSMTEQDVLEGRMIIEIGIAAVRPAEFIVLRFSHKLQEA